jgi:hypothetical protein
MLTQPEGDRVTCVTGLQGCLVSGTRFKGRGRPAGQKCQTFFSVECFDLVLSDGMMLAALYVLMPACM